MAVSRFPFAQPARTAVQRSGVGTRWEAGGTTARTHRISGPAATPSAEVVASHLVFPSKNKSVISRRNQQSQAVMFLIIAKLYFLKLGI